METYEYFGGKETNRHRELTWGVVREPPSPFFPHQDTVLRIAGALRQHVDDRQLGIVAVAPLDVVLDPERHLIVQPDVLFVSTARLSILKDQVWGAPDLVVEVCSPGSRGYDGHVKRDWYRRYGVTEYWLADIVSHTVIVIDTASSHRREQQGSGEQRIPSWIFPELNLRVSSVFGLAARNSHSPRADGYPGSK